MQQFICLCIVLSGSVFMGTSAFADEATSKWGHLKGRVLFLGEPPRMPFLVRAGGGLGNVSDESFVVDRQSKGVANVMLYLPKKPLGVHPDLVSNQRRRIEFSAVNGAFKPHAMIVRTDQEVACTTSDVGRSYAIHSYSMKNPQQLMSIKPNGVPVVLSLPKHERLPLKIACDIHPWMTAYWLVLDHPYAAITGKDGSFEIKQLPAGDHEFRVWQERIGYVEAAPQVKVFTVTVTPDETTTLDVEIPIQRLMEQK